MESKWSSDGGSPRDEQQLDSWKEIARYLGRSVRTVQTWEKREGLPVRRHQHLKAGTVYAFQSEIDAWREGRADPAGVSTDRNAWRLQRLWLPIAAAALLLTVGVSWRLTREQAGIAPAGSEPAISLEGRDWLLIANFANLTGEEILDGTLEAALRRELAGFVKLAPEERLGDSLRLLQQPGDAPVDETLARKVVRHDEGLRGVLIGRVERDGAVFRLSLDLLGAAEGTTVVSLSEVADGADALLPAINDLSLRIRESLGEAMPAMDPADQDTGRANTPSFQTLRLYGLADQRLREGGARADRTAEQLLSDAIAADPDFAPSHTLLAWTLARLARPPSEFLAAADAAFEARDRATAVERYFIVGSRHHLRWLVVNRKEDLDAALAQYQALLELDPGQFWARNTAWILLNNAGLGREALAQARRSLEARPGDVQVLAEVALQLVSEEGDLERARAYAEKALQLQQESGLEASHLVAMLEFIHPHELWVRGDVEGAVREVDRIVESLVPSGAGANPNLRYLAGEAAAFYLDFGMYRKAEDLQRAYAAFPDARWQRLVAWRRADGETILAQRRRSRARDSPSQLADAAWDLAHMGFPAEAEAWLEALPEELPASAEADRLAAQGTLDLAAERYAEAVARLEASLALRSGRGNEYFRLSLTLARALAGAGDLEQGIPVLERASRQKARTLFSRKGWMEARLELASLYREAGRLAEAAEIEDELRRSCAWAEPDFPIRQGLARL